MSGLQGVDAGQPNIALSADDLLSKKSLIFTHPQEVLDDRELALADKRSLLASWASDAHALVEHPSFRQLTSGAVVRVDDIMAALKSLDLNEPRHEAAVTFSQSFARRPSKPIGRRRNRRSKDNDEPPPSASSAMIPAARKILIGVRRGNTGRYWEVTNGSAAAATGNSREARVGGRPAV